ncbi:nineteen complex-related protein 2-domain-containing protein [Hypoxylon crocopeplum]|nr:nineteen complex-related protein 2-domain-containing protein [Hypoxylon crocopeplum]
MSAFGAKRKARKITVQDDDDDTTPTPNASLNPPEESQGPALQASFKTSRKPFKHSSLRKSINIDKIEDDAPSNAKEDADEDEDGGAPLRVRPQLGGRSGSTKTKKRASSSRLSFGVPREEATGDEDSMILGEEISTPKRGITLAHAAAENIAYKKGIAKNLPLGRLPMRSTDTDDDRPRYSKEYLSELQLSTPNTPQDLSKLQPASDDEMILDPSELEGAVVVDTIVSTTPSKSTTILTEAQIQEKKSRRARLAQEGGTRDTEDFISLSSPPSDNDQRSHGDSYLSVLSQRQDHKSKATRLVAEDEDLGEGFDSFVDDGALSLGRKAEREARRKRRAEMASLITVAEGGGDSHDDESDDSEAERRAAYEAAQTRAGMDGLAAERRRQQRVGDALQHVVMPKITPLPDFSVLVAEFAARVRRKEDAAARLRARIEELRVEREGIRQREPEVQRLLNEAGERYRALMVGGGAPGSGNGAGASTMEDSVAAAKSLLDQARIGGDTPGQRGLESLGTTPVRQRSEMEI